MVRCASARSRSSTGLTEMLEQQFEPRPGAKLNGSYALREGLSKAFLDCQSVAQGKTADAVGARQWGVQSGARKKMRLASLRARVAGVVSREHLRRPTPLATTRTGASGIPPRVFALSTGFLCILKISKVTWMDIFA